ncbi:MAG: four helix bundle protein [Planctomycetota bacterium]|jgi:four helix bundle protein
MMTPEDLKKRTTEFGLRIIRLVEALPRTLTGEIIGKQLLRCGTSVGANYRAACRGRSKAEFIAKLGIVEEEADESAYWMEMLIEAKVIEPDLLAELLAEADELTAIMAASRKTVKVSRVD